MTKHPLCPPNPKELESEGAGFQSLGVSLI